MTEQNRIRLIIQDPDTYYVCYDEKYKTTLDIIKRLEDKQIPAENLLYLRAKLAELAGKRAITIGVLKNKNTDLLIKYWNQIVNSLEAADDNFENIEAYEKNILYIQKRCLED